MHKLLQLSVRRMIQVTVFIFLVQGHAYADHSQQPNDTKTQAAITSAELVLDEFMRAFNATDVSAWADTLLFPHVRVASGAVVVVPDKQSFVAQTDMMNFARVNNWARSEWDSIEVVQADPEKVHFKVQFSRFNPAGQRYASFDSLYIVQKVDDVWGIRARSSFAP